MDRDRPEFHEFAGRWRIVEWQSAREGYRIVCMEEFNVDPPESSPRHCSKTKGHEGLHDYRDNWVGPFGQFVWNGTDIKVGT